MSGLSSRAQMHIHNAVRLAFADSGLLCVGDLHAEIIGAAEAELLRVTLDYHTGNQLHTARTLGLSRNTVPKLMRKHGVVAK
jgi:DNA-binding protein Fis